MLVTSYEKIKIKVHAFCFLLTAYLKIDVTNKLTKNAWESNVIPYLIVCELLKSKAFIIKKSPNGIIAKNSLTNSIPPSLTKLMKWGQIVTHCKFPPLKRHPTKKKTLFKK